jgi:hypothetical protein
MWLTLPFTLPFIPGWLRVRGLDFLKRLNSGWPVKEIQTTTPHEFDENDIQIGKDLSPSVNLIAVARKR